MKKIFTILTGILTTVWAFAQTEVTGIYTDFANPSGSIWRSTVTTVNANKPNNSHNLLAFTVGTSTYSTGANDALLSGGGISFTPQGFVALPVNSLPSPDAGTYVGVGYNYGGAGNVVPVPVNANLEQYLTDGNRGLDLGTAIFNLPASSNIYYDVDEVNPGAITDNTPDIIVTQVGTLSSTNDYFGFVDAGGNLVGNQVTVNFTAIRIVGTGNWKFYNANVNPPTYNAGLAGDRDIRVLALKLSDFGINASNYGQVNRFYQRLSGLSDQAFAAYNANSISIKQFVSGTVYLDADGGTPDGTEFAGAAVLLLDGTGNTIATTTTDALGNYSFNNISAGNYSVKLTTPTGYYITGNAEGNTDPTISAIVADDAGAANRNFGIKACNAGPTAPPLSLP